MSTCTHNKNFEKKEARKKFLSLVEKRESSPLEKSPSIFEKVKFLKSFHYEQDLSRKNLSFNCISEQSLHEDSTLSCHFALRNKKKLKKFHSCSSLNNFSQFSGASIYHNLKKRFSVKNLNMNDGRVFSANELEIKEVLGEGFFGIVYKIIDKKNQEVMVMKELKNFSVHSEKLFINELDLLKQISHNNLLKYIGIVLMKSRINIICEYIPGGTLRKLIKDGSVVLTPKIKLKLVLDISAGMAYLHSKNIAHRDLTSKNCMIRDRLNFDVVVTDFGLSRVIHRITSIIHGDQIEKVQERVGTPYWMAPEMLLGLEYNLSVDIFSFGIVLCEILSRKSAHPDHIPRLKNFGLNEAKFLDDIRTIDNPPILVKLALTCCDMKPDKRPQFVTIYHILQLKTSREKIKRSLSEY